MATASCSIPYFPVWSTGRTRASSSLASDYSFQDPHLAADNKPRAFEKHHVWFYLITRVFDAVETGLTYIPVPLFAFLIVRELAGQTTVLSVMVDYFSKGGHAAPWSLATLGGGWAIFERKLRQHKVKSMSDHIKEMEREQDPNRTSSGLTQTGQSPARRRAKHERNAS